MLLYSRARYSEMPSVYCTKRRKKLPDVGSSQSLFGLEAFVSFPSFTK